MCDQTPAPTALSALSTPTAPATLRRRHHHPRLAALGSGAQTPSTPTTLTVHLHRPHNALPTHSTSSPPSLPPPIVPTWPPLVRSLPLFYLVWKYLKASNVCPNHRPHRPQRFVHPHRPQRFAQPLYVVTTITFPPPTAATAHRLHSSAIVPTWPLVRSLPLSHLAALGSGFQVF